MITRRFGTLFGLGRQVVFRTFSALAVVFRLNKFDALVILVLTGLSGTFPVATLWISKNLINAVVAYLASPHLPEEFRSVLFFLAFQCGFAVVTTTVGGLSGHLSFRLSRKVSLSMSRDLYNTFASFQFENVEDPHVQDIMTRSVSQSGQASSSIFTSFLGLFQKTVVVASSCAVLVGSSPLLAILAVIFVIPRLILNGWIAQTHYDVEKNRTQRMRQASYLSYIITARNFARDNILYGLGRLFSGKWEALARRTNDEDLRLHRRESFLGLGMGFLNEILNASAYVYIVMHAVTSGLLGYGNIVMNIGLFANAQGNLQGLVGDIVSLYRNSIYLADYHEMMNLETDTTAPPATTLLPRIVHSIVFDRVSFKYPGTDRYTLKDFSLRIDAKEHVCLVGKNGTGKTTFVKLLLRLYEPTSGRILIDGTDIRSLDAQELRRRFGVLTQDYSQYLFSARENVILGDILKNEQCVDANYIQALRSVHLLDKVEGLSSGHETILGRVFGGQEDLSSGEWQRLALARVLFRDAPIIILDEPTSVLDPEMERVILRDIQECAQEKILIAISHRLTSVRNFRRVVVIDRGKVVEDGNHSDLLRHNGEYATLFAFRPS